MPNEVDVIPSNENDVITGDVLYSYSFVINVLLANAILLQHLVLIDTEVARTSS